MSDGFLFCFLLMLQRFPFLTEKSSLLHWHLDLGHLHVDVKRRGHAGVGWRQSFPLDRLLLRLVGWEGGVLESHLLVAHLVAGLTHPVSQ